MHRRGLAGCIWFPFRDLRLSQTADFDGHFGRRLLGRQCLDLHIPGGLLRFHALSGTRPALPKEAPTFSRSTRFGSLQPSAKGMT